MTKSEIVKIIAESLGRELTPDVSWNDHKPDVQSMLLDVAATVYATLEEAKVLISSTLPPPFDEQKAVFTTTLHEPRFVDGEKGQVLIRLPNGEVRVICEVWKEPETYRVLCTAIFNNNTIIDALTGVTKDQVKKE